MAYDLYPAIDLGYNFPPEVRAALAASLELRNTVVPMTTTTRNNLLAGDKWDGRLILNTTLNQIERWDADLTSWIAIVDVSTAQKTLLGNLDIAKTDAILSATGPGTSRVIAESTDSNSVVDMRSPVGAQAILTWRTGASMRWSILRSAGTEPGSNVGSDLSIYRYSDAGASLGTALSIKRSTGEVTVAADPTSPLGVATKQYADEKLPLTGGTIDGFTTINGGSGILILKAGPTNDHVYMTFFADSAAQSTRSGYFGYGTAGSSQMTLSNEVANGNIQLTTQGTGRVLVSADPTSASGVATKQYVDNNAVALAGDTMTGPLTISQAASGGSSGVTISPTAGAAVAVLSSADGAAMVYLRSEAGQSKSIAFCERTGSLFRWVIQSNGDAEAGANAGSNLIFQRYDDAGASLGTVLNMNRKTGLATFGDEVEADAFVSVGTGNRVLSVAKSHFNGTVTGALLIEVPSGTGSTFMGTITITGYNYLSTQGAWRIVVGGYLYTPAGVACSWVNTSVHVEGNPPSDMVQFLSSGMDTTSRWAILIGDAATAWAYATISVDVTGSRSNTVLYEPWPTSIVTTWTAWTTVNSTINSPRMDGYWQAYTPALVGVTIGNGSIVGRYSRIGNTVTYEAKLTFGSTTTVTGAIDIGIPVTKNAAHTGQHTAVLHNSTVFYSLFASVISAGYARVVTAGTGGVATNISNGVPAALPGTSTSINLAGTYEAA